MTAYPNGPLLVRGDVEITDGGVPLERVRRTVALCRCGGSAIRPLCDGTHKVIGFESEERCPLRRDLADGETVEVEHVTCILHHEPGGPAQLRDSV